jgi:hypothetical protein
MPPKHRDKSLELPNTTSIRPRAPRELDSEGRVIKGMRRIRWAEDPDEAEELVEARNSPYYWWWMFLRESHDYNKGLLRKNVDESIAGMAADFGRLGDDFDWWWLRRGREIFSEQMTLPRARILEHGVRVNLDQINPKLVVELPLTIRRATIIRQINQLLDKHHAGAQLRVMNYATAKRKLYAHSRIRLPTLELLYRVWKARNERPDESWYMSGEKLKISPVFIIDAKDTKIEQDYKRRCMTIVVQRYYRKAQALIEFAAKGDFPRIK